VPAPAQMGSIYNATTSVAWFEHIRARRVGDVLTIKLVEKTKAKKQSNSEIKKSNNTSITNPTLAGWNPAFGRTPQGGQYSLGFDLSSSNKFKGEGDADQSNELVGDITVMVHAVLPNGNLVIKGEKRVSINTGTEYIRLSGIVRPIDIDSSNPVESTRLADATIMYVGDGQVADAAEAGWLSKFFLSDFSPF
jgi:flagellar L-ring protein precursor FlgH